MKKHTKFGKVIFWLGFLFAILGLAFNEKLGAITDGPEFFSTFSIPSIIIGIILIVISNFLKSKNEQMV